MSRVMKEMTLAFPTRSDTNRAVQPLEMARGLIFWIKKVEASNCDAPTCRASETK